MKPQKLTGSIVPRFRYDTPEQAGNDFYALCEGETPLVLVFLANFGHPISRTYLAEYFRTYPSLKTARMACVVRSDARNIAKKFSAVTFPFPLICDEEGILYDYFGVKQTTSALDGSFAARSIIRKAKREGYVPEKGACQTLPLLLIIGKGGEVLYAHRGRSVTDMPDDCYEVAQLWEDVQARNAKKKRAL